MILRNVATRHCRQALAAPAQKLCLRFVSTETLQQERGAIGSSVNQHSLPTASPDSSVSELQLTRRLGRTKTRNKTAVRADYTLQRHIKKQTAHLGAVVEPHYEPHQLLVDPPKPEDVTLELLMASQSHLGHSTSLWNPMNQRYIYGVREGIHIIALETTAAHLRRAAKIVEGVAYHGGLILFVGTRPGQGPAIVKAAELAKGCHLFERWIAGSITNGSQILLKCDKIVVDKDDQELEGFDNKIADWAALKPDLVVVLNPLENYILLHECGLNNIPTIGVIDTDADPTWVTYPIPANDDSLRTTQLIAGVLGRAGQSGQERRLEAAKKGEVTWLPPPGLRRPWEDNEERQKKIEDRKIADEEDKTGALLRGVVGDAAVKPIDFRASGRTAFQDIDDL